MSFRIAGTINGRALAFVTVGPTSEAEARETFAGTHPHVIVEAVEPLSALVVEGITFSSYVMDQEQARVALEAAKLTENPATDEE